MDLSVEASRRGRGLRILVTRLRFLGDIIISTAAVAVLRKRYPGAVIYYLAEASYAEILEENPDIDGIIRLENGAGGFLKALAILRSLRITAAIDLFYNPTSANLLFLAGIPVRIGGKRGWRRRLYTDTVRVPREVRSAVAHHIHMMRHAGCEDDRGALPAVYLAEGERETGKKELAGLFGGRSVPGRTVAFHPGGTWQSKRWPEEHFSSLADSIAEEMDAKVLMICGPGEEDRAAWIAGSTRAESVLMPNTGLRSTASVMAACDAVVADDGGIMHLSVALGVPTVGIFGPTERDIWFPYEGRGPFSVATLEYGCSPCHLHHCEDRRCLLDLTPDAVMGHLRKVTGW